MGAADGLEHPAFSQLFLNRILDADEIETAALAAATVGLLRQIMGAGEVDEVDAVCDDRHVLLPWRCLVLRRQRFADVRGGAKEQRAVDPYEAQLRTLRRIFGIGEVALLVVWVGYAHAHLRLRGARQVNGQ